MNSALKWPKELLDGHSLASWSVFGGTKIYELEWKMPNLS